MREVTGDYFSGKYDFEGVKEVGGGGEAVVNAGLGEFYEEPRLWTDYDKTIKYIERLVESLKGVDKVGKGLFWKIAKGLQRNLVYVDGFYECIVDRDDVLAHNIVIAASALRGDVDRAFATYKVMERRDVQTYNCLMMAVEMAGGRTREVEAVKDRMEEDGVEEDGETVARYIGVILNDEANPDGALRSYRVLRNGWEKFGGGGKGWKPCGIPEEVLDKVLRRLVRENRVEEQREVENWMREGWGEVPQWVETRMRGIEAEVSAGEEEEVEERQQTLSPT
ncbi:hypothetical protein TrST_g3298 [Triparma strigata]|uniref:Pentatricopeptide repeat-containing protein n=2 Tax=Triparma TaxID=722752 RepID=A0A9W7ET90_9STRA|nr:hypothetical protein TrST_g3298 [Triparma strigata]